jgi:DNA (cytosine-5)-methyltransferase 1
MNIIDLFSGCGGLSLGFQLAGFNVLLGVDNDAAALKTFEKNHINSIARNIDLSSPQAMDEIKSLVKDKKIDVIVAGPPCQGFSLTGPRKFDDPRNKLFLSVIKAVKTFSPKAFVIENVPGMATLYKGQVKDEIVNRFQKLGYNVEYKILLAADYGVPQMRRRLVFVGLKKKFGHFSFPEATRNASNYVTCEEAIGDLPPRTEELGQETDKYTGMPLSDYAKQMRGTETVLHNHVATNHTDYVKSVIALVPPGGNYKDLPPGVGESRKFHVAWTRYDGKKPSNTIDTGHRNHFHYKYNRVPTIREFARLQSFPDNFVFLGTKTQQNRQVGNAVPPLLGKAIALQILNYISDEKNQNH